IAQSLIEGDNDALIVATRNGITEFIDGMFHRYSVPHGAPAFSPLHLLRDRDGGFWIGTQDRGLVHIHQGRADVFSKSDGLSADYIYTFFEAREGNIWVATANGLDQFREFAVTTLDVRQGLTGVAVSVLADRDESVWLSAGDSLNRWNNRQIEI